MSFSEIKKSINSNLNKPLDTLIAEKALAGIVKNVQRGTAITYANITIAAVDLNKSILIVEATWCYPNDNMYTGYYAASCGRFIDNHTIKLFANQPGSGSSAATVAWQVIEFY